MNLAFFNTSKMNLIDNYVIEVLSEPVFKYKHWFVRVSAVNESNRYFETSIMVDTEEKAKAITKGYKFLG